MRHGQVERFEALLHAGNVNERVARVDDGREVVRHGDAQIASEAHHLAEVAADVVASRRAHASHQLHTLALGDETDIEIIDQHDRDKLDAPSGTAVIIGNMIAELKGTTLDELAEYGREGHGARKPGGVGFHSLRAGDITSDHKVYFGGMGERLEITHYSYSDDCFARGAVDCAAYLQGKPAGVYSIKDVFDLR